MAHGPKSKKRHARARLAANKLAQWAGYRGAEDAAAHAKRMNRCVRRTHVLSDVFATCESAGYR